MCATHTMIYPFCSHTYIPIFTLCSHASESNQLCTPELPPASPQSCKNCAPPVRPIYCWIYNHQPDHGAETTMEYYGEPFDWSPFTQYHVYSKEGKEQEDGFEQGIERNVRTKSLLTGLKRCIGEADDRRATPCEA